MTEKPELKTLGQEYQYGFHDSMENYTFQSGRGLTRGIVESISAMKKEPEWMSQFRLDALATFLKKPMPTWADSLSLAKIDFDNIRYYMKPTDKQGKTWEEVPEGIKNTFDRLGIPEAERKFLAGVTAQYECLSEDTLVMANPSIMPIKDVKEGMHVYALNERTRKLEKRRVLGSVCKGERPVFEVNVGGRFLKCTVNHPFLKLERTVPPGKKRGQFSTRWSYLSELKPGDYVAVAKRLPEEGQPYVLPTVSMDSTYEGGNHLGRFPVKTSRLMARAQPDLRIPKETTDDLLWFLGLYIGDGFLHRPIAGAEKSIVDIAIPATEKDLRRRLQRAVRSVFGYRLKFDSDPYRVRIRSKPIVRFMAAIGMDAHAKTKTLPSFLSKLPVSQRLAFIGGYIDSDGYVRNSERNSDASITSVNKTLLLQTQALAIACGLQAAGPYRFTSRMTYKGVVTTREAFRLLITGDLAPLCPWSLKVKKGFVPRAYAHNFSTAYRSPIDSHISEDIGFTQIRKIVPAGVKKVYDIEVEGAHNFVAQGVLVHNSEVVYHSLRTDLEKLGVVFLSMDDGLKQYPDIVKKYFATVIPTADNKFSALNSAVWSGGSFIYVPKGVSVPIPLQAYFRINSENMGQFERTLIIADEGSFVHYIEGCTAPTYSSDSLHSAVVELIALPGAKIRYTTIQNWSKNVFNLVTKRALAHKNATVEWIDGNLGCLAEGSTVTTPEGVKPIEEVEVGESVLSYDETAGTLVFRPVTAKRMTGRAPVRRVSSGSRSLWVTDNHPFFSYSHDAQAPKKNGRYPLSYVRADHLKEAIVPRSSLDYGQPYTLQRPSLETHFHSNNQYAGTFEAVRDRKSRISPFDQTTNDILWLFGYWVGDGNIEMMPGKTAGVVPYAKVGFSTPPADRARGRLVDTVSALLDAPYVERRDGNPIYWSDTELAGIFHANGFVGKADTKRVPAWVWSLPESQRLSFVAGYLDADGVVISSKRLFSIKSVNRLLLEDVSSLLLTLGIPSNLYTEFEKPRQVTMMGVECTAHGSHRLDFSLDPRLFPCVSAAMRSKALAAPPATLRYKRRVGRSQITLPESVEIVDVTVSSPTEESVPVWDIEVEGTGNFVSQGFIVHNSQLTMKYPAIYLVGEGARGEVLSVAFSGKDQHQDAGSKIVHAAANTTSVVTSKSISKDGGRSSYRGLVKVVRGATGCKSNVRCDALILDEKSRSDTYPTIEIDEEDVSMGHEATVSKIGEEQLFYLQSRGLSEHEATLMIVNGFFEPFTKELPMEYAVELNRLLEMEMEGSVG